MPVMKFLLCVSLLLGYLNPIIDVPYNALNLFIFGITLGVLKLKKTGRLGKQENDSQKNNSTV